MNDKEYFRLKNKIQDEHRRNLEALDLVWQVSNGCPPPKPQKPPLKEGLQSSELGGDSKGKIAQVVEQAVAAAGPEFTTKDIAKWVLEHGETKAERSTISHALKRMSATIELLEKGMGKRPSRWRKLQPEPELCDVGLSEKIRELIRSKGLDANQFQKNVLLGRYKVARLAELTKEQALTVFSEITSKDDELNELLS